MSVGVALRSPDALGTLPFSGIIESNNGLGWKRI